MAIMPPAMRRELTARMRAAVNDLPRAFRTGDDDEIQSILSEIEGCAATLRDWEDWG